MQALAQRVSSAKILINAETHSSINQGILAYVCFEKDDNEGVIDRFISKITNFCIFKMFYEECIKLKNHVYVRIFDIIQAVAWRVII